MSFLDAVIPGGHKLFTTAANHDFLAEGPEDALVVVGLRVNDTTTASALDLVLGADSVLYSNLADGEILTGTFQGLVGATSTADSVIVFYR